MKVGESKYRLDIDGLRAVAVLAVLFYHAEFGRFAGGFVGVDVFFVISGFLITRLIVEEIATTNAFAFRSFYIRRFRRLFPALFAMLLGTFIAAFFLFSPQHLERLSSVLLLSLVSLSNIYFWKEAGYFGTDVAFKPLLHTWSLSVEEQFYFLWPLLLYILFVHAKKLYPVYILFAIGVLSFLLNLLLVNQDVNTINKVIYLSFESVEKSSSAAFFLTPFRVFEFCIGAMLVWFCKRQAANNLIREVLTTAGLCLILYSVFRFSESTSFPSYNALIPCFGAAFIIYAGGASYSGWLLKNSVMVGVGKLSYSLYLVHWPIIVFYKYWKFDELSQFDKYGLCIASFAAAVLLNKYIERPFRYGNVVSFPRFRGYARGVSIGLIISLCLMSSHAWSSGGWSWRLPAEIRDALSQDWKNQSNKTQRLARDLSGKYLGEIEGKRVLFVGDSYMGDLVGAMGEVMEQAGYVPDAFNFDDQCLPFLKSRGSEITDGLKSKCAPVFKKLSLFEKKLAAVDLVVFHSRWQFKNVRYLEDFLDYCSTHAKKECPLIVLGSRAEWIHVPTLVAKMHSRFDIDSVNAMAYTEKVISRYHKSRNALAHHTRKLSIPYVDLVSMMCEDDQEKCHILDKQKNILIYDHGHWTVAGQKHYGKLISKSVEFQSAMQLIKN